MREIDNKDIDKVLAVIDEDDPMRFILETVKNDGVEDGYKKLKEEERTPCVNCYLFHMSLQSFLRKKIDEIGNDTKNEEVKNDRKLEEIKKDHEKNKTLTKAIDILIKFGYEYESEIKDNLVGLEKHVPGLGKRSIEELKKVVA